MMLVTGELQSIEHSHRAQLSSVLVKQSNMLSFVPSQTIDKLQLFLVSTLSKSTVQSVHMPGTMQRLSSRQVLPFSSSNSLHRVHE